MPAPGRGDFAHVPGVGNARPYHAVSVLYTMEDTVPQPPFLVRALLLATVLALGVGIDVSVHRPESGSGNRMSLDVTVAKAVAGRYSRASRRTQRATQQVDYYKDLPKGCEKKGQYYYCGGTYYMPRYHNGRTRYVVVYP